MNPPDAEAGLSDREIAAALAEALPPTLEAATVTERTRSQLRDLLEVPRGPLDRAAFDWVEAGPGLRLSLVSEDASRGIRRCLVWGRPGASTPRHGHAGDEVILVLEGRLRDDRGFYGPGDICRSGKGEVHQEQVVGDEDCVCFVVYYGDLIPV